MPDMGELIWEAIVNALPFWWEIFSPILFSILVGSVLWRIVKLISRKFVYFLSVVSGDTKRETRRKSRNSDNLIDLASAINDIKSKK